jgi:hypothetical protein
MPPLIVVLLLAAHGLVQESYLQAAPPARGTGPGRPFHLDHSWALTPLRGPRPTGSEARA